MAKEIKVRNIPDKMFLQLQMMAEKYHYPSFNEFMLAQIQNIVINDGLDMYENKFANQLSKIKMQQAEILEQLLKNEIQILNFSAKQDMVQEMTEGWLHFMEDVEALKAEEHAGGGK